MIAKLYINAAEGGNVPTANNLRIEDYKCCYDDLKPGMESFLRHKIESQECVNSLELRGSLVRGYDSFDSLFKMQNTASQTPCGVSFSAEEMLSGIAKQFELLNQKGLKHLSISTLFYGETPLSQIAEKLPNLEELELTGDWLLKPEDISAALNSFSTLKNLRKLTLGGISWDGNSIGMLGKFNGLKDLALGIFSSEDSILALIRVLPELKEKGLESLRIYCSHDTSEEAINQLTAAMDGLKLKIEKSSPPPKPRVFRSFNANAFNANAL